MFEKPLFTVPIDLGAITTGNERPEQPAVSLKEADSIGLAWRSNGNGSLWVRGDLTSPKTIDFISLISTNAQPGTTVRVLLGFSQGGTSADYDSGPILIRNPPIEHHKDLYHSFLKLDASETIWWWRIEISGHSGDFQASTLVIGNSHQPEHFYSRGFEYGVEDMGSLDINRWGIPDEVQGVTFRRLAFTLAWESIDNFEMHFRPMLEQIGIRRIIHICFDPAETEYRQARTYMGWLNNNPFASVGDVVNKTRQDFTVMSMI